MLIFYCLYTEAIRNIDTKWERKFAQYANAMEKKIEQLNEDVNRGFHGIPAAIDNHIYLQPGEHCSCCTHKKKLQRTNKNAPIGLPYTDASTDALQEQMVKIIKYFRGNNLVGRTDVLMILFGSRSINLNTERKTVVYTETMKTYLTGLSQSWDNGVITDKSETAYHNTQTLCKHFFVAYFGDKFSTGFNWTSLDENVKSDVTELLECISFFWNKRTSSSGLPSSSAELVSPVDAANPLLPMHLSKKSWLTRRVIVSVLQDNVAQVRASPTVFEFQM
ncbi:uncharacterized protein EV154DRAFT_569355 [Mucor mucedo]|uniref:uncharacterized protein n=1 Tax=Mucor mucedo TaxID=29922 RepID=UPI002220FA24|nr:uncharacterized protein EV154DRAFT_569355 [Mucor mucedo]KAI7875923.1 hypothetical protein EV154DRAFT_569355 [Mucor mucedo]